MHYLLPYQINDFDFDFYFFKYQFSLFPTSRYCDTHSPYAMLYSTHNEATSNRHVKMSYKWHLFHRFHRLITVIIHHPLNLSFHPRFKIFYSFKSLPTVAFFSPSRLNTQIPRTVYWYFWACRFLLLVYIFLFCFWFGVWRPGSARTRWGGGAWALPQTP